MTWIILTPDGTVTEHPRTPSSDQITEAVGGYFEVRTVADRRRGTITVWMGEDAKRDGHPLNEYATMLLHATRSIAQGDHVAGTVVLTGGADAYGNVRSLPTSWIAALRATRME